MTLFSTAEQIVNLNVGGHRFATSRHTLTWIPDTFFTRLVFYLSSRLEGTLSSLEKWESLKPNFRKL